MIALRLIIASTLLTAALAYSGYGFPGYRSSSYDFEPFHQFGGFGSHRAWPYHEEAYRPPCPQYKPMELGDWEEAITPYGGAYQLSVMLPGVHPQNRLVELLEGGRGVHISGYRQVPTRGRVRALECLPDDARLSRDGRYEILDAKVLFPQDADASQASVRHGRQGLEVTAPLRREPRVRLPPRVPAEAMQHERPQPAVEETRRNSKPSVSSRRIATAELQMAPRTDGIEITEEEYPYPEKDPDAAEGWFDNRNEFQPY
mmetsp:Transcript_98594/g.234863  ORF Transcript_98594/g.234863 Transcript_98594/m.234863 type:complete len:259 (-) Transcript_98594:192-968(-)|eukprot:CAMPEP_0181482490 /NCGR_PEP_ID=MMETSP1110-20121109/44886_1 /TAXON_ID=174948 /ORGANISM="Symbiodinium sp., Strain CCMP421" /LENGTH=258 /DNA_ID=CAMNT_0023608079 /DNA_START=70 /DNA_END=846 /DNA_ORIENTATION=-